MRSLINGFCLLFVMLGLLFASLPVSAAETTDREATREELAEARKKLNDAAREVAELTRELGEGFAFHMEEIAASHRKGAMLGVSVASIERDGEITEEGLRIAAVTPGSPAEEAGLRSGDIFLAIDDIELDDGVENSNQLTEYLGGIEPGETVDVKFRRGDETRTVEVTTSEFSPRHFAFRFGPEGDTRTFAFTAPDMPEMPRPPRVPRPPVFLDMMTGWADMELVPVSEELGSYFGVESGLLVVRAPEKGDIELRDGDVILKIGEREPQGVGHALRILRSYSAGEEVTIEIVRERKRETVRFTMPERNWGMHWMYGDADSEDVEIIKQHSYTESHSASPSPEASPE